MRYIDGADRYQCALLPESIENYIDEENPVRVIDAFVDSLDMDGLGFRRAKNDDTGRPAYNPRDMLKLYLYGYFNKIRSSRKLMTECGRNLELLWLLCKLRPDFRTIADFRKNNAKAIRNVFRGFAKLCLKMGLYKRELLAVDGTKIRARNSKGNCYTAEVLEKKMATIDEKISRYMNELDENDGSEKDAEASPETIKAAVKELTKRKEKYAEYFSRLTESGKTQLLTTDPEARRMHSKDGFHCCYNVQTAVDGGSHLIAEYEVTNHNTDQGLLNQVCEQAKEILETKTVEAAADKGYESREDIFACLMNGTVPNVALKYDKHERVFNIEYEKCGNIEELRTSATPEDIKACLHAGVLPDCYKGSAVSVEVQEISALSCFTKNPDGTVTCPTGCLLGKTKTRGANEIFADKDACRQCKNRCTASRGHKTVSFGPDTDCVPVRMYGDADFQRIPVNAKISAWNHTLDRTDYTDKKKVVIRIREDREKLKARMCLSEHPFGTVKWYHGAHYLLCKGKEKASAELGLSFLAYNLRRAITLAGVPALLAGIRK